MEGETPQINEIEAIIDKPNTSEATPEPSKEDLKKELEGYKNRLSGRDKEHSYFSLSEFNNGTLNAIAICRELYFDEEIQLFRELVNVYADAIRGVSKDTNGIPYDERNTLLHAFWRGYQTNLDHLNQKGKSSDK